MPDRMAEQIQMPERMSEHMPEKKCQNICQKECQNTHMYIYIYTCLHLHLCVYIYIHTYILPDGMSETMSEQCFRVGTTQRTFNYYVLFSATLVSIVCMFFFFQSRPASLNNISICFIQRIGYVQAMLISLWIPSLRCREPGVQDDIA